MNYLTIFITGLTTGGLTCLAVQGGLLASLIAQRGGKITRRDYALLISMFLAAKLAAYVLLGFLLGAFGSIFEFSLQTRIILQIVISLYMIGIAGNLLNLHPIFRYFVIQPPRFLTKFVRKNSKNEAFIAPLFLGALTIFVPCGTTLAMEALAISSGSGVLGALTLGSFILGTIPLFFILGFLAVSLGEKLQQKLYKFAAVLILILALSALDGALTLTGSSITIKSVASDVVRTFTVNDVPNSGIMAENVGGEQVVRIEASSTSFNPNSVTVKSGIPVRLDMVTNNTRGCIRSFVIPKYNIQKILPETGTTSITFTPTEVGKVVYSCSMGMYTGEINVI